MSRGEDIPLNCSVDDDVRIVSVKRGLFPGCVQSRVQKRRRRMGSSQGKGASSSSSASLSASRAEVDGAEAKENEVEVVEQGVRSADAAAGKRRSKTRSKTSRKSSSSSLMTVMAIEELPPGLFSEEPLIATLQNVKGALEACLLVESGKYAHYEYKLSESSQLVHVYQPDWWSCGYRNLQMLLIASLSVYPNERGKVLFGGRGHIPDVPTIQRMIELAWAEGFDPVGAAQLNFKVQGSKKWIGTTEIASLLRWQRIPCDVHVFEGSQAGRELVEKIKTYFMEPRPDDTGQAKLPLYLQRKGHSILVVGVEIIDHDKTNLLVFDPGMRGAEMRQSLEMMFGWEHFFRRNIGYFQKWKEYEVVEMKNPENQNPSLLQKDFGE